MLEHWYLYTLAPIQYTLILKHWYLYTLTPIQYTLILENWDLCICTYAAADTWTLILIYIGTHTVYTDTWTLRLMHLHLWWMLILEHWYLYTFAPIQYTLILERWHIHWDPYSIHWILEHWHIHWHPYSKHWTWTLRLIYIGTHTVYADTWTLTFIHCTACIT